MASNDTYIGSLEVLAKQLASMSLLGDANLPFVMGLLDQVQNEMRSPQVMSQKAGIPQQPEVGMGMPMAAPPPSMLPPGGITSDGIAAALGGPPPPGPPMLG